MSPYSYRKLAQFVTCFVVMAIPAAAQYRPRTDANTLRAVGVMETTNGKQQRMIPVSLFTGGKYYDAGFYQSTPAPMALYSETVYEVQKAGVPQGLFTISSATRLENSWYGNGEWKPFKAATPELATKSTEPKPSTEASKTDSGGVFHMGGAAPSSANKNDTKSDSPSKDTNAPSPSTDDSDRPVLRRPKAAPSQPTASESGYDATGSKAADEDPNRPMLKRGAPAATATQASASAPEDMKSNLKREYAVAVSDASKTESHPLEYHWDGPDQQKFETDIRKMMSAELSKNATSRGVRIAPKTPIQFSDFAIRSYDLDYSNNPLLVATGKFVPTADQMAGLSPDTQTRLRSDGLIVTMVARGNSDGSLTRVFAEVSDPRDLETFPAMQLVDAVDADGDGRGELLFANMTERGRRFVLYRLFGGSLNQVFATAAR